MNINGRKESCGFEHCCLNFSKGTNGNCISGFEDVLECWAEASVEELKINDLMKKGKLRLKIIGHYHPCYHCSHKIQPKEVSNMLNVSCPSCENGTCDFDHENSVEGMVWTTKEGENKL